MRVPSGQTDMTKPTVDFLNFAEALKMRYLSSVERWNTKRIVAEDLKLHE